MRASYADEHRMRWAAARHCLRSFWTGVIFCMSGNGERDSLRLMSVIGSF
ncbi:hypothetical protein KBA01_28730 [Kozakia baliensis]|nr:hypothetical protein KBA01_28730 [Kozakia baliensis]